MSDFQINDYLLQQECEAIAADIADEFRDNLQDDESLANYESDMHDRAHDHVDGHQWVIYNYKALMLCAHCGTENGENFLSETGVPENPDIYKLATTIAYGEMSARIAQALNEIITQETTD